MSNQGNAKDVDMPAFQRIEKSIHGEFVDKLRWIIRAAKRADGLLNAAQLEQVIEQYYPTKTQNN